MRLIDHTKFKDFQGVSDEKLCEADATCKNLLNNLLQPNHK